MKFLPMHLRRLSVTLVIALLLVSGLTRIVSASLSNLPAEEEAEPITASGLLCPPSAEVATLLDAIASRDADLAAREETLALREQDVKIARQEIEIALGDLVSAEERLAARMDQSSRASEEDVGRLVNVYEGMKAKDAAVLFEAMDPSFASGFLARMRPDAASAIFSNLSAEKAYAVSVLMAGRNANAATE